LGLLEVGELDEVLEVAGVLPVELLARVEADRAQLALGLHVADQVEVLDEVAGGGAADLRADHLLVAVLLLLLVSYEDEVLAEHAGLGEEALEEPLARAEALQGELAVLAAHLGIAGDDEGAHEVEHLAGGVDDEGLVG